VQSEGEKINKKTKAFLLAFGITSEDIQRYENDLFFNPKNMIKSNKEEVKLSLDFSPIEMPEGSELLSSSTTEWASVAKEYLTMRFGKATDFSRFYISLSIEGFVIIPFYFRNKLIYWQARNLDPSAKFRWLNPVTVKESILFNMDEVEKHSYEPIYLTEGLFDAIPINGVGLLGSTLNDHKIQFLSRSRRDKILILDKDKNGKKLAEKVLSLGWGISILSTSVKDVSESVQKYGVLWTEYDIKEKTMFGLEAQVALKMVK
jgi:hypothetical protein